MNIQILKENRNEIIEMINDNKHYDMDLVVLMKKVAEGAQLGCYFGMEDMKGIVLDCIQELRDEMIKAGAEASNWLQENNKKRNRELYYTR